MRITKGSFWRSALRGSRGALMHAKLAKPPRLGKGRIMHRAGLGTLYGLFLKANSREPSRKVYNILEAFKDYVIAVDRNIDSAEFAPRQRARFSGRDLRVIPEPRAEASELRRMLDRAKLTPEQKKRVVRIIGEFRRKALAAAERTMQNPFAGKEEVLRGIEGTGGLFLAAISEISSVCHGVGPEKALVSRKAFENFSNALQIKDDIKDAPEDWGIRQNIIASISLEHPEEHRRLREKAAAGRNKKLSMKWLSANAPKTAAEAVRLFEQYTARIPNTGATAEIKKACVDAFYGL